MTFFQAPPITVTLPRTPDPLFTIRGPLTNEGTLDSTRLATDICQALGMKGKVSLKWMSDELGIFSHEGVPKLTVRVH